MEFFDGIRDLLGGGNLSLWLVVGGLIAVWLAIKAVKMVVRLALLAIGAALWLGTVPWAGAAIEGPAADCAVAAVAEASTGWETNITKRITVENVSADATCDADGVGLATGAAVVRLRSFYDVPFQTWDVTPDVVEARSDLPDLPTRGSE